MDKSLNWRETIITAVVKTCGYSVIVFVVLIFFFLLRMGCPPCSRSKLGDLLTTRWYPIENYFGILPLLTGSLVVTVGAMLIAIPFGMGRQSLSLKSPHTGAGNPQAAG